MQNRKQLVNELRTLLSRKQSREYYAKRLDVSVSEINDMLAEIHGHSTSEETSNTKRLNVEKGEVEISGYWDHEPTVEEIIKSHNINPSEYKLSQYWSKQKSKGFQVSACFKSVKQDKSYLQDTFVDFLKDYKPAMKTITPINFKGVNKDTGCLILNMQDLHLNKYDIKGNNVMSIRFSEIESKINKIVTEVRRSTNLSKIVYTLGSDIFNSEWTGFTTHGTPQQNVTDYHKSFEAVCEHEISIINFLLNSALTVDIIYVPGNHDFYVGWNLVKWLQAYYREQPNLKFNIDPASTKFFQFGSSALCFNHGYKIKPEDLVHNFAAQCNYYSRSKYRLVFTGDKHTEHSKTIGGCKFFRIGTTSNAVSNWDDENGYNNCKGEMTAFLIDYNDGMTRTYYEPIKY